MNITPTQHQPEVVPRPAQAGSEAVHPFDQEYVSILKSEYIELTRQASYWQSQYQRLKAKFEKAQEKINELLGTIEGLKKRLFGKKTEKGKSTTTTPAKDPTQPKRSRGQQPNNPIPGRTQRPNLPVIEETIDLKDEEKTCPVCGLPLQRNPALDETTETIEIEVRAHTRRIHRPAYMPQCHCKNLPAIITPPPPPSLIPRSPYGTSVWVEVMLNKYLYGQPTNRYLDHLNDLGFPLSPGTVAGALQQLAPLFEPIEEALYTQQMNETLFFNDETRWEVFVHIEGKSGTRWYLWVTRSESVIYYNIDPSRSAAVPGAHFAGLQNDQVIIVCDRYSAYKKLARLAPGILLAFCWVHMRRDFLDAACSFNQLEPWALDWTARIGQLYHHNRIRLEYWDENLPLDEQSPQFNQQQQALQTLLDGMHDEAQTVVSQVAEENIKANRKESSLVGVKSSAEKQQVKVYRSLLDHWAGLILFLQHPQVPLDNNLAENAIRNPVTGRKSYYGSGSVWSALLAAMLFSILQTLKLWDINPRHWLFSYLNACAENGGQPPKDLSPFIPWQMDEARRKELSLPLPPNKQSP